MADPKYANLYGIAHDQPDMYETSDLPEADQLGDIYEEESKTVEILHISAPEAFSKFRGKALDSTEVDFSDSLPRTYGSGYKARSNQWELAGFGEKETPLQKYNRLKLDFENLSEELSATLKSAKKEPSDITELLSDVSKETNVLLKKIMQFKLEDLLGMDVVHDATDPRELHYSKLQNKLEKLTSKPFISSSSEMEKDQMLAEQNVITYQLKLKPNQTILTYTSRIAELEQRINKLESVLGCNNNQLTRLCSINMEENGLLGSCEWMISKLSLLDTNQLDAIENRASAVTARLDQVSEKLETVYGIQDPEKEKKINELYELSTKANELSEVIPSMLDRMIALESLHQQGKHCIEMLSQMEMAHAEIASTLANNETTAKNIDHSFKSNIATVQSNIDSLQHRIDALVNSSSKNKK